MVGASHHVENIDLAAGFERGMGAAKDVDNHLGRFLVEAAKEGHNIVGASFPSIGVVVTREAMDAVRAGGGDFLGNGGDGGQVVGVHRERGVALGHKEGVGAGATREVEDACAFGEPKGGYHGAANAHSAAMHGESKTAGTRRIIPEVEFRRLNGLSGARKVGKALPSGLYIAVVGDGLREVVGRTFHEREGGGLREGIAAFVLLEEAHGNRGIEEEAEPAQLSAEGLGQRLRRGLFGLFHCGEDVELQRCKEHGGTIEGAREVNDFRNLQRHGKKDNKKARPVKGRALYLVG